MKKLIIGLVCVIFIAVLVTGCNRSTPPEIKDETQTGNETENVVPPTKEEEGKPEPEPVVPPIPEPEPNGGGTMNPANKVPYRYFLIRTDGGGFASPSATMCQSVEDLQEYTELLSSGYYIGDDTNQWSFVGFTQKYDEDYFQENIVLFILLDETNANVVHRISTVGMENSDLIVDIIRENLESEPSGSAQWNIAVELPNTVGDAKNFIINLT